MSRIIRINGEPVAPAAEAAVVETEPGVYSRVSFRRPFLGGSAFRAPVVTIVVNGHRFRFEVEDPRQWKRIVGGAAGEAMAAGFQYTLPCRERLCVFWLRLATRLWLGRASSSWKL